MSDIPAKIHPHNLASGESSDEEEFNLRSVYVFTEQFEPSNLLFRFTGTGKSLLGTLIMTTDCSWNYHEN